MHLAKAGKTGRAFVGWASRWLRCLTNPSSELKKIHHRLGAVGQECQLDPAIDWRGELERIFLGKWVRIDKLATLECASGGSLKIGNGTVISSHSMLLTHPGGSIEIGEYCSVNPFSVLYGHGGLKIGNNVRIATHCVIIPANHNFDDPNLPIRSQGLSKRGICIEDDVWIGAGVRILDGVTIGKGSVIGAGAVVARSIPPYSVAVGVPAKVVRKRGP